METQTQERSQAMTDEERYTQETGESPYYHDDVTVTINAKYAKWLEGQLASLRSELVKVRPKADAYDGVCRTLGIEKDVLGYVSTLRRERDEAYATIRLLHPKWFAVGTKGYHLFLDLYDAKIPDDKHQQIFELVKLIANMKEGQ
jgi:hypothetical protein